MCTFCYSIFHSILIHPPTHPPTTHTLAYLTQMFNTAMTRAKQWLVVVGEPFTLCTVGENRVYWMEFIKCCQALKSFDYTHADQFTKESLDYKIVARQLLEKVHSYFFSHNKPPTLVPAAYSQGETDPTITGTKCSSL